MLTSNNTYPTFLASSYQEASQALRSESINPKQILKDLCANQKDIFNGIYTFANPKTNQHRTIKISSVVDENNKLFGKRIISILAGSNNNSDYLAFGFFDSTSGIKLWKKFANKEFYIKLAKLVSSMLIESNKSNFSKLGITVTVSKNCLLCNRLLTDQSSLVMGVGPICAGKIM